MLDMHAVTGTGDFTKLVELDTILPGGDFATVPGVPIDPKATLIMWGAELEPSPNIIGMAQLRMQAQGDQVDPVNAETFNIGGLSNTLRLKKYTNLPYSKGARVISMFQAGTTPATRQIGFTIDHFEGGNCISGSKVSPKIVLVSMLPAPAGNGLEWQSIPVTNDLGTWVTSLPNGKYAILGAWVSNVQPLDSLLRFRHADFGAYTPGFSVQNVLDPDPASTFPNSRDVDDLEQGWQFVKLGKELGKPCCPVFTVSNAGTGLIAQYASLFDSEEPVITLNLAKVA